MVKVSTLRRARIQKRVSEMVPLDKGRAAGGVAPAAGFFTRDHFSTGMFNTGYFI